MPISTALSADQIADIVTTTLETPLEGRWRDISLPYQSFLFAKYFMSNSVTYGGGRLLTWELQVRNTENVRYTGAYDQDVLEIPDLFVKAEVNWSVKTVNMTYDILEEVWNGTDAQIVDMIQGRQHSMMNAFFKFCEEQMWNLPSSEDNRPYETLGIPVWVVKTGSAGLQNFAFDGGNPSNHDSGAGNVDSDVYTRWKNGTFTWSAISETDFFRKLAEATVKCNFMAPDPYPTAGGDQTPQYIFCTVWDNLAEFQEHVRATNENHGRNIGYGRAMDPTQIWSNIPIYYVPVLDNSESPVVDTDDPFYGLDMSSLKYAFVPGWDKKIQKPIRVAGTSTQFKVPLHSKGQFKMLDRRTSFVAHKA